MPSNGVSIGKKYTDGSADIDTVVFFSTFPVPESEDNTREAQDTPAAVNAESSRNETDPQEQPRPRKSTKIPKSNKIIDGPVTNATPTAAPGDEVTTEANVLGKIYLLVIGSCTF